MNTLPRTLGRLLIGCVALATFAGDGRAAPALKPRPADGEADLPAIHQAIAKAAAGTEMAEADLKKTRDMLTRLLARVDALENLPAEFTKGRKLPAAFDSLRPTDVTENVRMTQKTNALAVAKEGKMIQSMHSVLLAAGDVQVIQSRNCVIIAGGDVKMTQCSGCIVVAGRSADLVQCLPRKVAPRAGGDEPPEPLGCLVIAGERLKCSQSGTVIGFVLAPDRTGGAAAIQSSQGRDLLFLNAAGDWKSNQDRDSRAEPAKAAIAK